MCVHTKKEPSSVIVDLQRVHQISEIKVACRANECANDDCKVQCRGWVIRVGNSGTLANDEVCRSNIDASGGKLVDIKCDTKAEGRYISVHHNTWMVLCEIQVFSQKEG